jgi:RimJ/RimL family protein N-acetyltransferase
MVYSHSCGPRLLNAYSLTGRNSRGWLHPGYLGRGYATRSVGFLTEVALSLRDVDRIEIHADEANTASAAIARRLGYRLDRLEPKAPRASGDRTEADLVTP